MLVTVAGVAPSWTRTCGSSPSAERDIPRRYLAGARRKAGSSEVTRTHAVRRPERLAEPQRHDQPTAQPSERPTSVLSELSARIRPWRNPRLRSLRGAHVLDQLLPAGHQEPPSFGRRHRACVPEVVVDLVERCTEAGCRLEVPEAQHRVIPLFQRTMRLFRPIVQVSIAAMDRFPAENPPDRLRI